MLFAELRFAYIVAATCFAANRLWPLSVQLCHAW